MFVILKYVSARAQPQEADVSSAEDAFTGFKHLLLPITDRNPYLSEGTRQVSTDLLGPEGRLMHALSRRNNIIVMCRFLSSKFSRGPLTFS